jgi:hypothetical protein
MQRRGRALAGETRVSRIAEKQHSFSAYTAPANHCIALLGNRFSTASLSELNKQHILKALLNIPHQSTLAKHPLFPPALPSHSSPTEPSQAFSPNFAVTSPGKPAPWPNAPARLSQGFALSSFAALSLSNTPNFDLSLPPASSCRFSFLLLLLLLLVVSHSRHSFYAICKVTRFGFRFVFHVLSSSL